MYGTCVLAWAMHNLNGMNVQSFCWGEGHNWWTRRLNTCTMREVALILVMVLVSELQFQ